MNTPTYLYFTLDEYRQRLQSMRLRMEQKGVDVMLVHTPENIYYISGYQSPGYYWYQALVVPLAAAPMLIPPPHEEALVSAYSWVTDYRLYHDTRDWVETTRDVLADLGMGGKRIGVENDSWFFTSRDYLRLKAMMPDATFVDCSGLVEQGRITKSPQEIEYMRHAASAAEAGMLAGLNAIAEGVSEAALAAEIHRAQFMAGSEYTGLPTFVTSGLRSMLVHATWSKKTVARNEMVFFEVPGCINRYHAAMTRAAYTGDPPDLLLRATETNTDALALAKAAIKPGVPAHAAFEAARDRIASGNVGYRQGRRVAYSIGIAFPPGWDEGHIISINENEERPFAPGMTFHLITTMRIPGLGAIGCSDTVLVTHDGCETLTAGVEQKLHLIR
jgi:Xaa-Pro dipeptidase